MTIKTFWNIIRNRKCRRALSGFKRTVMVFILVPVMLFGTFIIVNYSKKLRSEYDQRIDTSYQMICDDVEGKFEYIADTHKAFTESEAVQMYISGDLFDTRETLGKASELTSLIKEKCYKYDWLSDVCLYSMGNGYMTSPLRSGKIEDTNPSWYQAFLENGRTENLYSEGDDIVVTRGIKYKGGKMMGILAIRIDKEEFLKSMNLDKEHTDYAVTFSTRNGDELISSGEVNVGKTYEYRVGNYGTDILFEIDSDIYNRQTYTIIMYAIACIVIGILGSYILSVICAAFAYDRVAEVLSMVNEQSDKSVAQVSKHVLEDVEKDEDVEKEIATSVARLQQAQLTALQMQINPHFLFNVLGCINVMILQKTEKESASDLVNGLSDILRYAMTEPKYSAKIAEEIEMAKKYVEIERIELGNDIEVKWDIQPEVLERECIKLFLQPIIENSIMHGVKKLKGRRGVIEVSARCKGEDTIFVVKDNGNGIPKQKLASIRKSLKEPYDNYSSSHIGMRNVNERIKLVYGKNYGVTVDSDESGTKVTIKIGSSGAAKSTDIKDDDFQIGGGVQQS